MSLILKNLSLAIYKSQFFSTLSILHRGVTMFSLFLICVFPFIPQILPYFILCFFVHLLYVSQRFFLFYFILFFFVYIGLPFCYFFFILLISQVAIFFTLN